MPSSIKSNQTAPLILAPAKDWDEFDPAPDEACFCGSGKTFIQCCGTGDWERPPPHGVFLFENYIGEQLAREMTEYADQCDGEPLMMIDEKLSTPGNIVKVQDDRRITERVKLGHRHQEFQDIMGKVFIELAERCAGVKLDWYEMPNLMRYREGGHYTFHADSMNRNPETGKWHKVIDRDLSILLYLNNGFEGGELTFNTFDYVIQPGAAGVVLFPSDHRYMHQAHMVTKGVRYAMVSWASVQGVPKIAPEPPKNAVFVEYQPD